MPSLNTISQIVSPNTQAAEQDLVSKIAAASGSVEPRTLSGLAPAMSQFSALTDLEATLVQSNSRVVEKMFERMV
jgi:hypothetical protein